MSDNRETLTKLGSQGVCGTCAICGMKVVIPGRWLGYDIICCGEPMKIGGTSTDSQFGESHIIKHR